jgi:hypothetical protein
MGNFGVELIGKRIKLSHNKEFLGAWFEYFNLIFPKWTQK